MFQPGFAGAEFFPHPSEMFAGSQRFGFQRPAPDRGIGGFGFAWEGDDFGTARNSRGNEITGEERADAMNAEVFGPVFRPEFDAATDVVGDVILFVLVFAGHRRRIRLDFPACTNGRRWDSGRRRSGRTF